MQIEVVGTASGRSTLVPYGPEDLSRTMLDFLRSHEITIASSCAGEGVCRKCTIQNDWLTCMMTLEDFIQRQPDRKVFVSYL